MTPRVAARVLAALAARPSLWATAVRQARRTARPGWWRRAPFLPLPPPDYVRFRLQTHYGGTGDVDRTPVEARDVLHYLAWCRQWDGHRDR